MKTNPNPQSNAGTARPGATLPGASTNTGLLHRLQWSFRPMALILTACFLGACASPYASHMAMLDQDYRDGRIRRRAYARQHIELEERDGEYRQVQAGQAVQAANVAATFLSFIPVGGRPGHRSGPGPGRPAREMGPTRG